MTLSTDMDSTLLYSEVNLTHDHNFLDGYFISDLLVSLLFILIFTQIKPLPIGVIDTGCTSPPFVEITNFVSITF